MKLTVDGREVFATTGGTDFDAAKPAVVFLHGAGFDRTTWRLQTRWFAHHGRSVLAVDFPAHGWSAGPALTSVAAMADWTAQLIAAAGLESAALVGHRIEVLPGFQYCQCAFARCDTETALPIRLAGKKLAERSRLGGQGELHMMRPALSVWSSEFHVTANLLSEFDECGLWVSDDLGDRAARPYCRLPRRKGWHGVLQPPLRLQLHDGAQR